MKSENGSRADRQHVKEGFTMCFRPSAVDGVKKTNVQYGECPTCGQPVAANAGVTSGSCPYCGNAIPSDAATSSGHQSSDRNVRII